MAVLYRAKPVPVAARYVVSQSAAGRLLLDASAAAWNDAAAVEWGPPRYRTRFRAMWDGEALYVRFDCADDRPWFTMTNRDDHLWNEEVVEIFLDAARSGRDYAEVEISPANIVCDVRMRAPYPNVTSDLSWDWEGLESKTAPWRDPAAGPGGWTALARLPWAGLTGLSEATAALVPPKPGDCWRFNVFRIKRPGGPEAPERDAVYAAWSVPEGPSFHVPAAFRDLVFDG